VQGGEREVVGWGVVEGVCGSQVVGFGEEGFFGGTGVGGFLEEGVHKGGFADTRDAEDTGFFVPGDSLADPFR